MSDGRKPKLQEEYDYLVSLIKDTSPYCKISYQNEDTDFEVFIPDPGITFVLSLGDIGRDSIYIYKYSKNESRPHWQQSGDIQMMLNSTNCKHTFEEFKKIPKDGKMLHKKYKQINRFLCKYIEDERTTMIKAFTEFIETCLASQAFKEYINT